MEKNKRKRSKKILMLLLLMITTGAVLSMSSYAWFTANKVVTVNTINVQVQAQNGIQISTDATKWKAAINNADILAGYSGSVNQLPSLLEPVSTGGNVDTNGHLEMFFGDVKASGEKFKLLTSKLTDEAETHTDATNAATYRSTGKYLAFDIFLKVNADTTVYLTTNSGVTSSSLDDAPIKNAVRVAFVELGNRPDGTALATVQGLNAGTASAVTIWEPNYNVHTAAAITHAKDTYGMTITADQAKISYDGVIDEIPENTEVLVGDATAAKNEKYFKAVETNIATKAGDGFTTYQQLFNLKKGITKIRVYFWVEGQDVDCENNASGGSINFDLQISTNSSASGV